MAYTAITRNGIFSMNPLYNFFINQVLSSTAFAFTEPGSPFRFLTVGITGLLTWDHCKRLDLPNGIHGSQISCFCFLQWLKTLDDLLITRVSYENCTSTSKPASNGSAKTSTEKPNASKRVSQQPASPNPPTFLNRLKFGLGFTWNVRAIGTPFAIRTHPFSYKDHSYIPTRRAFLLHHLKIILLTTTLFEVLANVTPPDPALLAPARVPLLSRWKEVTAQEAVERLVLTTSNWIVLWAFIALTMESLPAFLSVSMGLSSPAEWPPYFGRWRDMYTVRKFWGSVWHQEIRRLLTGPTGWVVDRVLRVPRKSLVNRYAKLVAVFALSGVAHVIANSAQGVPPGESGAQWFFTVQAAAIMVEDAVVALGKRVVGSEERRWKRVLGYVWVVGWLWFSTPSWSFPTGRALRPGVDEVLPGSLVGWVRGKGFWGGGEGGGVRLVGGEL